MPGKHLVFSMEVNPGTANQLKRVLVDALYEKNFTIMSVYSLFSDGLFQTFLNKSTLETELCQVDCFN